jgi:hypothetical protein
VTAYGLTNAPVGSSRSAMFAVHLLTRRAS